jgi:H+/Cl- antiporter ClcA
MSLILAYADAPDESNSTIWIVMISTGLVALCAGLAMAPTCIAWARRHRQSETIVPLALLWGLGAAISAITTFISQYHWSRDRMVLVESGYYDPQDASAAPALPWMIWIALAIIYVLLILWAMGTARSPAGSGPAAIARKQEHRGGAEQAERSRFGDDGEGGNSDG